MKIGAIIQGRMGSTRLPGKVMKEILGKSLLELLIERLRFSQFVDQIVIATTVNQEDDAIYGLAKKLSIECFRGSEDDVLCRYYEASKKFSFDHIVRLTADCPLIDPEVVDRVVRFYLENETRYDYVSNTLTPTYPDGLDVEIFSFDVLERLHRLSNKRYQREHVCTYLVEHPDQFRMANVTNNTDLSKLRLTVDEPEDFELVRRILENIYPKKPMFLLEDILALLQEHPDLIEINKDIERNAGFIRSLEKDNLNDEEKGEIIDTILRKKKIDEI